MTFEEWFNSNDYIKNHNILSEYGEVYSMLEQAWNAAIEATVTRLVRGTNLYNISGDHISSQVIASLEQLKAA